MLQKAGKRQFLLNKQDGQLNMDKTKSIQQQEVAEKMLQHASEALVKVVEEEDLVAIKVAKEFVTTAAKNVEAANKSTRKQQKRSSEVSFKRKKAL